MSNVNDALAKARAGAQKLNKTIQKTTHQDHAAIRAHLEDVAAQAQALSRSIDELAKSRDADIRQHLRDAATMLQAASGEARELANASKTDLHAANTALLFKARAAASRLSQAVATERSAKMLVRS